MREPVALDGSGPPLSGTVPSTPKIAPASAKTPAVTFADMNSKVTP